MSFSKVGGSVTKEQLAEKYYKNLARKGLVPGPSSNAENAYIAGFEKALELVQNILNRQRLTSERLDDLLNRVGEEIKKIGGGE